MRYVIVVFLSFLLSGCFATSPMLHHISLDRCAVHTGGDVGVVLELPRYLEGDRFPYKKGERFGFLAEGFAHDPEAFLNECAVRELGGCSYPWECERQPKSVVRIQIEEFYYDAAKGVVLLEARVNDRYEKILEPVRRGEVMEAALRSYKRLLAQIGR